MALGAMLDTRLRLAVNGADTSGFAVLAGKSADGTRVQVLVCNYEIPEAKRNLPLKLPKLVGLEPRHDLAYQNNRGCELKVSHLPWGQGEFTVKRYLTTDTLNWAETTSTGKGGILQISSALPPPGMEFIVIQQK